MNYNYWKEFYQKKRLLKPSSFAKFILKYIPKNSNIVDVGCGNGRDSYYFASKGFQVVGIDFANLPNNAKNAIFLKKKAKEINKLLSDTDVIYSRFFLHVLNSKQLENFIQNSQGLFMAETRAIGDNTILFPDHKRYFVDGENLLKLLIDNEFKILYYEKNKGLAKMGKEDPLIIRVIANKEV